MRGHLLAWTTNHLAPLACAITLFAGAATPSVAAPRDPGRLFYTPSQRAELEDARARSAAAASAPRAARDSDSAPTRRYDGVVIRSDGRTTRWVDGTMQRDGNGMAGLKPGQVRSGGRVYEPYQLVPETRITQEPTP